jgi:hypothetical protein
MLRAMNWAYDSVNHAGLGFDSAAGMAEKYRSAAASDDAAIDRVIRWHVAYAGAAGFVSNLGGLLTLPVAIPADLASVLALQLRMVSAIAHIRGCHSAEPAVRTLAFICLVGNSGTELLKEFTITLGTRAAQQGITRLSASGLVRINQAVGFRLVANAGAAGLVNLTKWLPVLGGLIGGGVDATVTRGVGAMAKRAFAMTGPDLHAAAI